MKTWRILSRTHENMENKIWGGFGNELMEINGEEM